MSVPKNDNMPTHGNQEVPLKVVSVRLSYWHIRQVKKLGNGSFTEGIRKAVDTALSKKGLA